jgi:hypoxanthine phosphoribosyltransferase
MDECFTVLGDKIYDVAQACVNKNYPLLKQKQSGGSVNGKPKLMFANGGPMDAGGFGSQRSFTIAELKAYLEKEFPYSLGFKLYPYKPNARTLEPDLSNYEGLTDAEIKDKLLFGSIGKWHSVNIEMQQGQENTYFYFALETESNKESYIGSFGFKDRGDVPLWYARKFINFLMDAYDMPKEEEMLWSRGISVSPLTKHKLSERMANVSELKELAELQPIGRPFPNRLRYSGYETGGPLKNLYAVGVYKGHLKYGQNNEIAEDVYEAKIKGNKDAVKKIELAMMDRFLFSDIPPRIGAIVPVKVTKAKFDIPLSVANYIHSCANYAVHPPQKMPVVINPTRATIQNKDVLVVDDVVYSGATLKKYEDMLKKLGARTISFLVYGKSEEQNEQKAVGGTVNPLSIQEMVESYIPPINYHNRKNEPFRFTVECVYTYSSLELQSLTENFKSYGYSMGYTSLIYSVDQVAGKQKTNTLTFKVRKYNFTDIN